MWLFLSALNVVISITTQCGYFCHHSMWLFLSPFSVVISITTQSGYLYHHLMWLSPSPLNVVISISTQCRYFYHHSMWLFLSPLNVIISITTIAGKIIFVPNFAIASCMFKAKSSFKYVWKRGLTLKEEKNLETNLLPWQHCTNRGNV